MQTDEKYNNRMNQNYQLFNKMFELSFIFFLLFAIFDQNPLLQNNNHSMYFSLVTQTLVNDNPSSNYFKSTINLFRKHFS